MNPKILRAIHRLDHAGAAIRRRLLGDDIPVQILNGVAHRAIGVGGRPAHRQRLDVGIGLLLKRRLVSLIGRRIDAVAHSDGGELLERRRPVRVGGHFMNARQSQEIGQRPERHGQHRQADKHAGDSLSRPDMPFAPDGDQADKAQPHTDQRADDRHAEQLHRDRRLYQTETVQPEGDGE